MPPRGRLGTGPGRIIAVAIAAAIAAELALLLLAPGDPGPDPAAVDPASFFDPSQIARGRDFQTGQRNLYLVGFAIELAALALLALGHPRRLAPLLTRLGARPVLGAAAVGAGISLALALLALPIGLIAHGRAVDVGLSTQDVWGWLADRGRSAAIAATFAAIGAAVLVGLQRRLPRAWWVAASGVVVAYAVVTSLLAPVVLAPLFNDFTPLPEGAARSEVLALAERAGVDVGEVYSVDASRRSTSLNAYVSGIGSTKRVVLYDNLLDRAEGPALRSVVAHELGHVAHRDIPRGILFVALVAPLGVLTVALAGSALARRTGAVPGTPAAVPAFALALVVVGFGLGLAGNRLSREVEASADGFALELTGDPQGFIALQRRLALGNVSDPDPSGPLDALLRTHPTTMERIGAAVAYRKYRMGGAKGASLAAVRVRAALHPNRRNHSDQG
jgi:STE24 endopeptidase